MRDRVGELNDEEASLANSLASTWGLPEGHDMPRLSLPFDRLLRHCGADAWTVLAAPDRPDTPHIAGTPIEGVHGDPSAFAGRVRGLLDGGYRVVFAADGAGSAERIRRALADEGVIAPLVEGVRIFAGYSGWTIGQLDGEIERDDWIVLSALPSDVLVQPQVDLWGRVLRRQPMPLSLLASHPIDVSRN